MENSLPSDESKVLIIYTGGTIGMLAGQRGYVPEPYFLTQTLLSQARFHDPFQDSLYSHSGTVEGFRQWTSTGGGSGRSSPSSRSPTTSVHGPHVVTLPVRSCRVIGPSSSLDVSGQQSRHPFDAEIKCTRVSENVYEASLPTLVTPRLAGPSGKRIRYAVLEVSRHLSLHYSERY